MRKTKLVLETRRGTDRLSVRVVDEVSRTMIASFELKPEDMWAFLGGAYVEIDGEITDHFDRVGKTMVNESVIVTRDQLKASTHDQQEADALQLVRADRPGWDEYEARRRGGGSGSIQVVMRRWEA